MKKIIETGNKCIQSDCFCSVGLIRFGYTIVS